MASPTRYATASPCAAAGPRRTSPSVTARTRASSLPTAADRPHRHARYHAKRRARVYAAGMLAHQDPAMSADAVLRSVRDARGVATVTLNRPKAYNAL